MCQYKDLSPCNTMCQSILRIIDIISHFLIYCNSNNLFWKVGQNGWEAKTGFNIREESYIHESILFGFHESSDDAININYGILYAKHYIYLEKFKEENKKENLT